MEEEEQDYIDDYIVTQVGISHASGHVRVVTYGPYTKNHAIKVQRHYRENPPSGNWNYTYVLSKMMRDDMEMVA